MAASSTSKRLAAGDSSDDDISLAMEPMKFSALTNALLNDEASVVEPSPPPARPPRRGSTPPRPQRHWQSGPLTQTRPTDGARDGQEPFRSRVVRLSGGAAENSSSRRAMSISEVRTPHKSRSAGSPTATPPRIVRLSGGPTTRRRSASNPATPVAGEPAAESPPSRQELITPAPRSRTVVGRNDVDSPAAAAAVLPRHHFDAKAPPEENGMAPLASSTSRGQSGNRSEGSAPPPVVSAITRSRLADEAAVQGSMRVKRVGKVSGAFLSGPARRGRQRQSEEAQSPKAAAVSGSRSPPAAAPVPTGASARAHSNSVSPVAVAAETSEAASAALVVPTLPPVLPSQRDQENEPPPTFRRSKPASALSILSRMDGSLLDAKIGGRPPSTATSPQRPALAPRSQNTPHRPAPPPPPPKMSILETATATAGAETAAGSRKKFSRISVNHKVFTRLDCIGRGGSSRVYRVMAENFKLFALKKVALEDCDESTIRGYKGEIDLLKKLENVGRVVTLYDYEINDDKHTLSVLMEFGESDLDKILKIQDEVRLDVNFVRHYWREMLECVQAVHQFDIVHSDLKPANFLLVKGRLKLIDFGIANAIQDDTVNVHREQTVGTPNYMAPEAIEDYNAKSGLPATMGKMMRLGKPSDVWSLGCILYRMVYGSPPFAKVANQLQRVVAITNPNHAIEFPALGVGDVPVPPALLRTLRACLDRDPDRRPTIERLLESSDPFLYPDRVREDTVEMSQELLGRILSNVVKHCQTDGLPSEAELASWPALFFTRIKQLMDETHLEPGAR